MEVGLDDFTKQEGLWEIHDSNSKTYFSLFSQLG